MIVVPLDPDADSQNLLASVETLARASGAEVMLVHVLPDPFAVAPFSTEETVVDEAARVTDWLNGIAARLRGDGVAARARVREGVVQAEVVAEVELSGANMIAMLTHSRQGRPSLLRRDDGGEHADLLEHARVPVFAIQTGAPAMRSLLRIMVPLDGTADGDAVLSDVRTLARASGASVLLIHVQAGDAVDGEHHLSTRVADLRAAGVATSSSVVAAADIGATISQEADSASADMIAMTARPRQRLGHMTLGRTVDAVMRGTTRPMLLRNPAA
jgi:nucleotide-binding universal stress UspA family protein